MKNFQIDMNFVFIWTLIGSVIGILSAVPLPTPPVTAATSNDIVAWATWLSKLYAGVTSVVVGYSNNKPGPLVGLIKFGDNAAPKAFAWFLAGAILAATAIGAMSAKADPIIRHAPPQSVVFAKPAPAKITISLPDLPSKVLADAVSDLTATKALADAQKDPVASSCYAEILSLLTSIQQSQTAQASNAALPTPNLFYVFQTARGFANAFQPNSQLNVVCAPLAQQVKMTVLQLVNALVTSGVSAATIGPMFGLP